MRQSVITSTELTADGRSSIPVGQLSSTCCLYSRQAGPNQEQVGECHSYFEPEAILGEASIADPIKAEGPLGMLADDRGLSAIALVAPHPSLLAMQQV